MAYVIDKLSAYNSYMRYQISCDAVQREILGVENLVNYDKFAKVSSAKIPFLILNNIKTFKFAKVYATTCVFVVNLPKFAPIKVFLYTIMLILFTGRSKC